MAIVEIAMTQGKVVVIDEEDLDIVRHISWCPKKDREGWYARGVIPETKRRVYMHRLILGITDPNTEVDHRDGNGLNNQRANLRQATRTQNARNKGKHKVKQSRFKGCYQRNDRRNRLWRSTICVNGKSKQLGYFTTEEEAARAYNEAAKQYFGEFARLNPV